MPDEIKLTMDAPVPQTPSLTLELSLIHISEPTRRS